MTSETSQLRGVGDARLAVHAASAQPAWLWSLDGTRVLWANPVGAKLFGARHAAELAARDFGPADSHRRQIAQLAPRLSASGATRLERLRGFGAGFGGLMTCACARLDFADGDSALLVVAIDPVAGRGMPLMERLQNLVDGVETPIAAFARDGLFVGASDTARALLGFRNLSDAGLDQARDHALKDGRAETPVGFGRMVLQRVGTGADIGLVALLAPRVAAVDKAEPEIAPEIETPPVAVPTSLASIADLPTHHEAPATLAPRTTPLRFVWQLDADDTFRIDDGDFQQMVGPHTAALSGHKWHDISAEYTLDADHRFAQALATRQTWSGVTLPWPTDDGHRLPVEFSALPLFDRARNFTGFRGFGICRDLDAINEVIAHRHLGDPPPRPLSADVVQAGPAGDAIPEPPDHPAEPTPPQPIPSIETTSTVQPPENVVQFRPGDPKSPALSPGENNAFNELARQLSARLESETGLIGAAGHEAIEAEPTEIAPHDAPAAWLAAPVAAPRGEAGRDRLLLDLMPVGVLIYRLDRLVHANPAFLAQLNYPSLAALEQAGGLDMLQVEADVSTASSASSDGTAVTIAANDRTGEGAVHAPIAAKLHAIAWDDEPAHALIFAPAPPAETPLAVVAEPVAAGHVDAEDLAAILDTMAEGVVMFDGEGNINSCNRSAEALFGYDGELLTQRNVVDLFAHESRRIVADYLESAKAAGVASLLDHGREALGQVRAGGLVPLSMIIGRTRAAGPNFFAVFRDLSQVKKTETELLNARRQADRSATAKADVLARISHEVRTPLNAIIGFADVMIDQRFGPLGNERYGEYLRDIRASGERVIAIVNDLLDLSRIETGKIDLAFTTQNLNEMVEQCVAVMQPQANRGRIIIRTSLAHLLPTILADARALRQITLNLIGNSIHLANAGGQVIVSTALSDQGDVVLRVRDTGHGLNENEVAAAMEPYGTAAPGEAEGSGVSLSLTRALVEANHARFQIKSAPSSGTLIEVVFSNVTVKA